MLPIPEHHERKPRVYSTCISCHTPLGKNQVLEPFPVGRRLAFDPHKGRLWVLCSSCRAWNLAPLEERWEAVEAAERLFERATIGSSTENVALGRVADGTEVLRVGRVSRPEMAAWRYSDRLLGRWKKYQREYWIIAGGSAALGVVPVLGNAAFGAVLAGMGAIHLLRERRPLMRTEGGVLIRRRDALKALLIPADTAEGWRLRLPRGSQDSLELRGGDALRALRGVLPQVNARGGKPQQVRDSVREVERLGSAERVLREAAVELESMENMSPQILWPRARPSRISTAHPVIQLALEMAVNEETERRALEGELTLLEREWREAEELAAIADDLLLPQGIRERIRQLKEEASQ